MAVLSVRAGIGDLVEQLHGRHPNLSRDMVEAVVRAEHSRFDDSPLRDYVPLLVERRAREELALLSV